MDTTLNPPFTLRVGSPALLAASVLALAVALLFTPVWSLPGSLVWPVNNPTGSDITYRHWPDMQQYAASLRAGRVDLWDATSALGRPLPGDTATLFMYPGVLLFVVLPTVLAFNLYFGLHLWLAGLGLYALLRVGYGLSAWAALAGGVLFALMPKLIGHMGAGHMNVVAAVALMPWALLGLKLTLAGHAWLFAALGGAALALTLPTHIQIPYYTGALVVVLAAWSALTDWQMPRRAQLLRVGLSIGLFFASFALVGAFVLLPLLELLPYNSRAGFTVAEAGTYGLPPLFLISLPLGLDLPMQTRLFDPAAPPVVFHEWLIGLGALALPLAAIGLARHRAWERWLFLALALFSLLYALGTATPLFGLAFEWVPGFSLLRVPTRMLFLGGLALAVLVGFGVEQLLSTPLASLKASRMGRILRLTLVGLTLLAALLAGAHWWLAGPNAQLLIKLAVLVAVLLGSWRLKALPGWLLVVLLVIDVGSQSSALIEGRRPADEFLQPSPVVEFLANEPDSLYRVYSDRFQQVAPAVLAAAEIESLEGGLAFQIDSAVTLIRQATGCTEQAYATAIPACLYTQYDLGQPDAQALGRLNVAYVVSAENISAAGFERVFVANEHGTPLNVYANLHYRERAYFPMPASGLASVEVLTYQAWVYVLQVEVDSPTTLTISHPWLPGWRAWINGNPVPVMAVEGGLVGVSVPAGPTTLRVEYLPTAWQVGWPITAITLVGLLVWCGLATWQAHHKTDEYNRERSSE